MKRKSEASILLYKHLKELFPNDDVKTEFRFFPSRKWKFDFAVPYRKLACEIDGGAWVNGRHNRASGWLKDKEKFNVAAALGWKVLHFTPQEVLDGTARAFIKEWFTPLCELAVASDGLPAFVVD